MQIPSVWSMQSRRSVKGNRMNEMHLRAYAKINTGLDVLCRRADGYHEVKMILQSVDIFDEIRICRVAGDDARITLSVNHKDLPADEKNLMVKAATLLTKEYGIRQNLHMDLVKNIPMAAGMAGGSADAAATLTGISKMFDLGIGEDKLREIGLKLGADIPFCLKGGTFLAEGIGEKLTKLPDFPASHIVVVKPKQSVSTKYVYENLELSGILVHPDIDAVIEYIHRGELHGIGKSMSNILEHVTVKKLPIIEEIKAKMMALGALGSNMSGSGPSVFALFDRLEAAGECVRYFQEHKKRYELSDVFLTKTFDKGVVMMSSQS